MVERQRAAGLLLLLCVLSASPMTAAKADSSETSKPVATEAPVTQTYPASFFDRFRPQSAQDMVEQLPGFSLDTGNSQLRGFGGTAGNVLIDGERPSSKSGGIVDALRRIPAAQVERIELIRGSAGASEAAGQAVVANIVRKPGVAAGSWEIKLERAADGIVYPAGELTLARRIGVWDTSTKFNAFWERFPLEGPRLQTDADGTLISSQFEDRPSTLTQGYVSSEAQRLLGGGTLRLTGRFGRSAFLPDTERLGFDQRLPDGDPDDRFTIDFDSDVLEGEAGADWTRPFDKDWSLKLLSLGSVKQQDDEQVVRFERPVGQDVSGSVFLSEQNSAEALLRGTVNREGDHRMQPEFGGEIAYNRLDTALSLETRNATGVTIIDLPASDVLVEELRGEVFANLIWRASERLRLESGIALELSEISVSGDVSNSQTFSFVKPFATAIFDPRPGLQLRLGVRRSVGQLDFRQFAASAEAADDRLLGGNPELGPDQTTRASFTIDLRSQTRGALNIEAFHEWRNDVIEQVLLPSDVFGAANAGDGRVWGVTANANLPLTRILRGAQIDVEADVRESTIRDPFTGRSRDIDNTNSPTVLIEFRQDLTAAQLSWGLSYRAAKDGRRFFGDEESVFRNGDQWSAFVESSSFWGIRTRIAVRNIGGRTFIRERSFFEPSRAGEFVGAELIDRQRGMFIALTLSSQF